VTASVRRPTAPAPFRITLRVAAEIGEGQGVHRPDDRGGGFDGQAFGQIKGLLEEVESEWRAGPIADTAARSSVDHRPERTAKPANHRVASAESLDGPVKLAAGEPRILTANILR
jgi:hypothetical protein